MREQRKSYWTNRPIPRRRVLRTGVLGAGALAGAALVGCGDDDSDETTPPTSTPAGDSASPTTSSSPTEVEGGGDNVGGDLRFGWTLPARISPRGATGGTHQEYLNALGDAYVYITSSGELDASQSLWESWEQTDGQTLVANLRQGVTFHDGTPFNSEAVKQHLDFMTVAENVPNFGFFSWFDNFESVEAIDEYQVQVKSTTPDASLISIFALAPGVPFSIQQVEALGDAEMQQPAMTGPYKVASYTDQVGMKLEANPEYWGERTWDSIDWQHIADPKIRATSLESGDVDAVWFIASDESTLILSEDDTFASYPLSVAPASLEMNHARGALQDLRVRQAVASALDKQKVIDIVSRGQGRPTLTGLMSPNTYGALEYEAYPFDLTEAKAYLDASGHETPLRFTYAYGSTGAASEQAELTTVQIYQEDLRQIGIELELVALPVAPTVADSPWRAGEIDFVIGSPGVRPDPSIQYGLYLGSGGSLAIGSQYSSDPIHEDVDALIQRSIETFDTEEREGMFHELQRMMVDNLLCRVQTIDRVRWFFHRDNVAASNEVINSPGGASFRIRKTWQA